MSRCSLGGWNAPDSDQSGVRHGRRHHERDCGRRRFPGIAQRVTQRVSGGAFASFGGTHRARGGDSVQVVAHSDSDGLNSVLTCEIMLRGQRRGVKYPVVKRSASVVIVGGQGAQQLGEVFADGLPQNVEVDVVVVVDQAVTHTCGSFPLDIGTCGSSLRADPLGRLADDLDGLVSASRSSSSWSRSARVLSLL